MTLGKLVISLSEIAQGLALSLIYQAIHQAIFRNIRVNITACQAWAPSLFKAAQLFLCAVL